jgi:DNA polymerase V
MGSRLFVLADADSFYASCERVFHPQLMHRPIVVLSNNDGCVVSRSREAKQLGISNGLPWFKIRGQAEHDGVIARSSNYELYASLSRRMMRLMASILPDQEIYSIDECFLRGFQDRQRTRIACRLMRGTVLRGIGIPLTVTTAPTRTLAKIVSHYAKRDNGIGQVLDQANKKFGAMSVGIGWAGMRGRGRAKQESGAKWNMKRQKLSSRSTTRWDELATAKAQ